MNLEKWFTQFFSGTLFILEISGVILFHLFSFFRQNVNSFSIGTFRYYFFLLSFGLFLSTFIKLDGLWKICHFFHLYYLLINILGTFSCIFVTFSKVFHLFCWLSFSDFWNSIFHLYCNQIMDFNFQIVIKILCVMQFFIVWTYTFVENFLLILNLFV